MKKEMLAEVNERRQIDPALCLLMWATSLNGDGPREVLKGLGVYHDELYAQFGGREYEFAKLRQLRMVGEMFNREFLAKLLRARLAELLMQCSKASDYAALMRAVKIMPEWVLDEQPGVDLRTEDPAFDDVMNQPLEDEDGNRLAPDFGTLAAGGPLLADRLYEQIRAKRAPGEVVADSNGADAGENGADAGDNGADAGENGAESDVGAHGCAPSPAGATHVSPADSEPCAAKENGHDPDVAELPTNPASTWKGSPTPCPESTEAVGAHGCAPSPLGATHVSPADFAYADTNENGANAQAADSVPPDETNETRSGSALIAGSKLAMALVNPDAVFNKPLAPPDVQPRNGKPRSRRRARP